MVPWFALWKLHTYARYSSIVRGLFSRLRPDYVYLLVSESDFGVAGTQHHAGSVPSNVLILSSSGMGHVAVPWLQCEFPPPKHRKITHFLTFCGNSRSSGERKRVLEMTRAVFHGDFFEYRGPEWKTVAQESLFALSPRGIAVATYRTYELIRMETIPVLASDEVHWLPYYPALDWSKFAIVTNVAELPRTANRLKAMTLRQIVEMRKRLHEVNNEFFQWDGFFGKLEMFFEGGKSYFTCSKAFLTGMSR
jgi:hypothetical protein